ncbi:hypothetical protein Tco_0804947 [Tanacetum coccineum]
MVHNYYLEEAKKKAQLQNVKALNSKPSLITLARLPNTASGSKPKPRNYNQQTRNWPPSMNRQAFGGYACTLDSIGKKRDKIATLPEDDQELAYSAWRRRHNSL